MKTKLVIVFLSIFVVSQVQAQKKKVAVVTFYVNKHIDFNSLGGGAALAGGIASLSEDPKFDLTSVLNNFHDVFFNEYAKVFPFDLLPESVVLSNDEYAEYVSNWGETKDEDRNGFVRKSMGLAAGIQAFVRMKIWNSEGEKVFKINELATSKKSVPMVAGVPVMKVDKLLPLCESASEELIEDLGKRIKKIASKSAKKL